MLELSEVNCKILYRKIPKMIPSMYKPLHKYEPLKLVTQKTLQI